jgi:L-aspartate oxidase
LHEQDTLVAGAGLCDPEAVRFLVQSAPEAIEWLVSLGAQFDHGSEGGLALGREGGHGMHRIVHFLDRTGWEVERTMIQAVRAEPRITVVERAFVTRLLVEDGQCCGVETRIDGMGERTYHVDAVMLATGGCGRMYRHTTNPRVATGDGFALGISIGAECRGMEFMQFHPTTLYHPQARSFLITEAVRGAGGTLRNHLGRRFMYDYDDRLELAPRDVVARAIEAEMKKRETWCVYLDMTHLSSAAIQHEFPTIYAKLREVGIEVEKDWIPVVPAQHYSCGGIVTDLSGRTNISGLFAAGEVASTGVHGANRLASNSLLEAIVFAGAAASVGSLTWKGGAAALAGPARAIAETEAVRIRRSLQRTMTENVGIVRTNAGLSAAFEEVGSLLMEFDSLPEAPFAPYPLETRNLLVAAREVVRGARARAENVGLHYNADLV